LFLVIAIIGFVYLKYTSDRIEEEEHEFAVQTVQSIEASINKKLLDSLGAVPEDINKPEYRELKKTLKDIIKVNEEARFVYIYCLRKGKIYFYGDSEPENSEDESPPGQEYTEAADFYFEPFITGETVVTEPVDDRWGTWISILVPIKDKKGKTFAVVGLDYNANAWNNKLYYEVVESSILIILLFLILIIAIQIRIKNRSLRNEISDREAAEQALEKHKRQLSDIIDFLPDATFTVDINRKVIIWNKAIEEMTGIKASEMIGKGNYEYTVPFYGEPKAPLLDLIFENNMETAASYPQITHEGSTIMAEAYCKALYNNKGAWVFLKVSPLHDESGKIIGAIESIRDITSLKIAAQELITAKEKAEESDRLKSAFLANMSHEIRTPMNSILGFADLLKSPMLTGEEQQRYVDIIEKSGARMLNIINDIIDISKIESGLMMVNQNMTNVNEELENAYNFFKPEVEKKGLLMSIFPGLKTSDAIIYTDREKFFAILTNLVKNAIKYTDKGSIDFGYTKKDSFLEFFVKDTGIGIPPDRTEAIFDRFVQADISDKKAFQGAGLGLSIAKAFTEMLGGEISVSSVPGKGSGFYFSLPFISEKQNKKTEIKYFGIEKPEDFKVRNLSILIAEDDEPSAFLVAQALEKNGHKVRIAVTGLEAVRLAGEYPETDLILMDIKMPEMDGYEAVKKIREFNKSVYIIAQTAFGMESDIGKSHESGFDEHISKPVSTLALLNIIKRRFRK